MIESLLERAVADTSDVLQPVLNASYSLQELSEIELLTIATEVNKKLGYDLFQDLYYPRLVHDFALVTRAVSNNAIKKREV